MGKFLDDYTILVHEVNQDLNTREMVVLDLTHMRGVIRIKIRDRRAIIAFVNPQPLLDKYISEYCGTAIKEALKYADYVELLTTQSSEIRAILDALEATRYDRATNVAVGLRDFEVEVKAHVSAVNEVRYSNENVSNITRDLFKTYKKVLRIRSKK